MSAKAIGRLMMGLGYLILFCCFTLEAIAAEVGIFAIQKNLQMNPKDPVFHDFYIDGGTEQGFQVGRIVTVVRRIPLHDLTRNRPLGDMHLPIAKLKIIFSQRGSSIARVHTVPNDKNSPVLEFNSVMIGDRIQGHVSTEGEDEAVTPAPEKKSTQPETASAPPQKLESQAEMSSSAPVEPKPANVQAGPRT